MDAKLKELMAADPRVGWVGDEHRRRLVVAGRYVVEGAMGAWDVWDEYDLSTDRPLGGYRRGKRATEHAAVARALSWPPEWVRLSKAELAEAVDRLEGSVGLP